MTLRLIMSALIGLSLFATPAMAKKSREPAEPVLPTLINTDPANDPENVLHLDLSNGGRVSIRMMPQWAPTHVDRIKTLVRRGFYDGIVFHRVIDGFMAQTGDPTGTGTGGSGQNLAAEFNDTPHVRGVCSMARAQAPNSADSQFFICFDDATFLDGQYTAWGRVISGMEHVDKIKRGEPVPDPDQIVSMRVASDAA